MNNVTPIAPQGVISLQTVAMPADTNWNGDIFGGWLLSQMDLAGAVCGRQYAKGRVTTVAIDSMVFLTPVKIGDVISCYTQVVKTGRTSMVISVEVWRTNYMNIPEKILTEGKFTFVSIDDSGRPKVLPDNNKD